MKKYSIEEIKEDKRKIPENLLKIVYDTDDRVLFGSKYVKGKVQYGYLPAELVEEGVDYIISVSITYDNIGNANLPKDAELMSYDQLHTRFTKNIFG